jgi:hypothetical protein
MLNITETLKPISTLAFVFKIAFNLGQSITTELYVMSQKYIYYILSTQVAKKIFGFLSGGFAEHQDAFDDHPLPAARWLQRKGGPEDKVVRS